MPSGQPLSLMKLVQTRSLGCLGEARARQVIVMMRNPAKVTTTISSLLEPYLGTITELSATYMLHHLATTSV